MTAAAAAAAQLAAVTVRLRCIRTKGFYRAVYSVSNTQALTFWSRKQEDSKGSQGPKSSDKTKGEIFHRNKNVITVMATQHGRD